MNKLAALLALAFASLALVACGGDDEGTTTTETGGETTGAAAGGEETGGEEAGGEGGGAVGGSAAEFEAAADGGLAYTEEEVTADAGKATIEFTNQQPISHDVAIEGEGGEQIAKTDIVTDETTTTTADLEPGEYTFYCTVPGHREAGMEGTLEVE